MPRLNVSATANPALKWRHLIAMDGTPVVNHRRSYPLTTLLTRKAPAPTVRVACLDARAAVRPVIMLMLCCEGWVYRVSLKRAFAGTSVSTWLELAFEFRSGERYGTLATTQVSQVTKYANHTVLCGVMNALRVTEHLVTSKLLVRTTNNSTNLTIQSLEAHVLRLNIQQ